MVGSNPPDVHTATPALLCPLCGARFVYPATRCGRGHAFASRDGVVSLLTPDEALFFDARDAALIRFRQAAGLRRTDFDFDRLPWSAGDHHEWRARCHDLLMLQRTIGAARGLAVLDVGSSNGWLSNNLCRDGHRVTAVDLFADDADGLGAIARYPRRWATLRTDIEDPDRLAARFDLVVINHGVHFLPDPVGLVAAYKRRVRANGRLVVLGLRVFADPRARIAAVGRIQRRTVELSGTELLNMKTRGYLDTRDATALRNIGLRLRPDRHHRRANLRARVQRTRPWNGYGCWRAPPDWSPPPLAPASTRTRHR